jgi:predicted ribosome quality control (RQC) complex YloA/Tae2 family protein
MEEEEVRRLETMTPSPLRTFGRYLLVSLLAGCVIPIEQPSAPAPTAEATPVVIVPAPRNADAEEALALLAYFHRVSGLGAEELRREYNAVNSAFAREKTEMQRMKLALLLSVPGAAFRDDARLLTLLDTSSLRSAPADSPQREVLTLLQRLTAERVRQLAQAKEEQRRIETQAKDDQKRLEQQLKDEQKRADELQQKLDALVAIDRELRQRVPQRGTQAR